LAVLLSTASPPLALYTLSLHDALPIFADFFPDTFSRAINSLLSAASDNDRRSFPRQRTGNREADSGGRSCDQRFLSIQFQIHSRSEEHTSELQSRFDIVCRLLLEKKKK